MPLKSSIFCQSKTVSELRCSLSISYLSAPRATVRAICAFSSDVLVGVPTPDDPSGRRDFFSTISWARLVAFLITSSIETASPSRVDIFFLFSPSTRPYFICVSSCLSKLKIPAMANSCSKCNDCSLPTTYKILVGLYFETRYLRFAMSRVR